VGLCVRDRRVDEPTPVRAAEEIVRRREPVLEVEGAVGQAERVHRRHFEENPVQDSQQRSPGSQSTRQGQGPRPNHRSERHRYDRQAQPPHEAADAVVERAPLSYQPCQAGDREA
jgi:hypothetical protein